MRNFYEIESKLFINISNYMKDWESYLGIFDSNNTEKKATTQRIASHVQTLWNQFNQDRTKLDKHYMNTGDGFQAYIASFLLPNVERVFSTLVRDENIFAIESLFLTAKEEIVITDFGCGPLSGTIGILSVFEYLFSKNNNLVLPKRIHVNAIDRSDKIVEFGKKMLTKSLFENINISVEQLTSPEKVTKNSDIILGINVFNEIPMKHRGKTLNSLYAKLNNGGLLLIMEPGQEEHAKSLGTLRNEFISANKDGQIISPCAHKKSCPLSSETTRKDWCWFRHSWNTPKAISLIDKFSKLDHHELNFSYLFVQKNSVQSAETFFARCISDEFPIEIKAKSPQIEYFKNNLVSGEKEEFLKMVEFEGGLNKILLCTKEGELESAFVIADPTQKPYRRGRRVKLDSELYMRAKERN
ncbi:small ribosomal subunit Rsm22 family protein [Pigmentibacter ruber]